MYNKEFNQFILFQPFTFYDIDLTGVKSPDYENIAIHLPLKFDNLISPIVVSTVKSGASDPSFGIQNLSCS
jgi:hypothetical protein